MEWDLQLSNVRWLKDPGVRGEAGVHYIARTARNTKVRASLDAQELIFYLKSYQEQSGSLESDRRK